MRPFEAASTDEHAMEKTLAHLPAGEARAIVAAILVLARAIERVERSLDHIEVAIRDAGRVA